MKSGNLNFLEPSGPLQACNGTALPLLVYRTAWYHVPENGNLQAEMDFEFFFLNWQCFLYQTYTCITAVELKKIFIPYIEKIIQ